MLWVREQGNEGVSATEVAGVLEEQYDKVLLALIDLAEVGLVYVTVDETTFAVLEVVE